MKNESLYRKTVDILYDAYFNDTLQHRNCYACAIGNLIAANNGYCFTESSDFNNRIVWDVCNGNYAQSNFPVWFSRNSIECVKQLESTGYSINEGWLIEGAFERASIGLSEEDYMFNGLVAVLEVLKQIHEVEDDGIEVVRFKNHYENKKLVSIK